MALTKTGLRFGVAAIVMAGLFNDHRRRCLCPTDQHDHGQPDDSANGSHLRQFRGKAYEGDAGVVTVTVAANSVFEAGQPVEWEQCNLNPTTENDCDGLTLQTTDVGSKKAVTPNADGSVTLTMELWVLPTGNASTTPDVGDPHNTNPNGFDAPRR